jgi:hypothetical protein
MFKRKRARRTYLVVACFDLVGADFQAYGCLREKAARLGLADRIEDAAGRKVRLPSTTLAGVLEGEGEKALRKRVYAGMQQAFAACRVQGNLFVFVSGESSWTGMVTEEEKK